MDKTFCEFFAGIGLVHEGLRPGGWQCLYANDIEVKKRQMYEGHFGASPYYHVEDVWNADRILERITSAPFLATASFPCIDLSLAGHWRGFEGKHSSTYFGFLEILRRMEANRPKLVMLENVYGFLRSHDGDDFRDAVAALASLGYWIDAIVLDAKWFVPQSRPRVFVFGFHEELRPCLHERDADASLLSPWNAAIAASAKLRPQPLLEHFETIALPTGWATMDLAAPPTSRSSLADLLDTDDRQEWWSVEETLKHYVMMEPPSRQRVDELVRGQATAVGTAFRRTRGGKTRTEVRFDLAGCLRTPKGGSAKQIVVAIQRGKLRMRWMSPVEYARLQGAGNFNIVVPPLQAMYGFGDAVCVPAIQWIDQAILSPLFDAASASSNRLPALWTA